MSGGFELQPQDGGPRVALAPGETVIGRGPLLRHKLHVLKMRHEDKAKGLVLIRKHSIQNQKIKEKGSTLYQYKRQSPVPIHETITDKRVSRRHAILEVVGGQLRIKPIHTNPCFYQSSEKSQLLPLKRNLWRSLNPGDSFSLLVDKYIFCVFSTHSETEMECTLRNSQMLDEDNILNETPKSSSVDSPDETTGNPQLARSTEIAKTQTATANSECFLGEGRDISKQQSNPAQRRRILPAWMLTDNRSDQDLSAPASSGGNIIQGSGKEGICRKRLNSSGSSKSTSAEQDTGKKCKNADQEESIISSKEMPQSSSAILLNNAEVNNKKANTQRSEIPIEERGKVPEHKIIMKGTRDKEGKMMDCSEGYLTAQDKSFHEESQGSPPESSSDLSNPETLHAKATDSVPQGSEENKIKRTSCMYGANCYRKNPVHFQHFSHPGDSDYGGIQVTCQDEADERPECPYGASCYRKNPQHKIEYRHSTHPVRSISDEDSDNVGRSNEYDLNDRFLDDEEEEYEPTDEDSDWEPGQEDQEKEDMEELLKEAKKFMKRKK